MALRNLRSRWGRRAAAPAILVAVLSTSCGSRAQPSREVTPWDHGTLGADGRTLHVFYGGGKCVGDERTASGRNPQFSFADDGRLLTVTLTTTKAKPPKGGACADVGLNLDATTTLPRAVEPAAVVIGGCRSDRPNGLAPPPDDPCLPGSPRVRSEVADTCGTRTGPLDPFRVMPSIAASQAGDAVRFDVTVTIAPGPVCHYDEFVTPVVLINAGPVGASTHIEFTARPSWGSGTVTEAGPAGKTLHASWMWRNWCGPAGDFYAMARLNPGRTSEQAVTTLHPSCTDANAQPFLEPVAAP